MRLVLSEGPPHLRVEADAVSETLCFRVSRIPDGGRSPKPGNSDTYV
jgi:hypothetical protein